MSLEKELHTRSNSTCETCGAGGHLTVYPVAPKKANDVDHAALLCDRCLQDVEQPAQANPDHWRCLNDSMWSEVPAVKIIAWRMLNHLRNEGWPADLLDLLYLDDEQLNIAKSGMDVNMEETVQHVDSNGAVLANGDQVTLIKDLDVKGANFTAKRGTVVRNIKLVDNNPEHIEGKVEGQQIVILTKFVKKSS